MGTWGEGLYDNDSALDLLYDLVAIDDDEADAARLVARIGLLTWLNPSAWKHARDRLAPALAALAGDLARLPQETRETLDRVMTDVALVDRGSARASEVEAVLGGYSDGPRLDPLLRFPGAQPAIDDLAARATDMVDVALEAAAADLYEIAGDLAALGVLIELTQAGLHRPDPRRVARWRARFDVIDKATRSERSFWWKYIRRVRLGFDLLAPPPAPAKPIVRKPQP